MNDKELDAILLRMGFFSIEHCEDEDESHYYLKAWFKWKTNESQKIREGKFQLVGHKDSPEEIINQAKLATNYLNTTDSFEFIKS